mgnify:CR=1 FL=1
MDCASRDIQSEITFQCNGRNRAGADSVIMKRLDATNSNQDTIDATNKDLNAFASEGLRTLCHILRVTLQPS